MDEYFTGSLSSLRKYWQNPERAKKFKKGGTREKALRYLLNKVEVEVHKGIWIDTAIGAGYIQSQLFHTVKPNFVIGLDFSRAMLDLVHEPIERVLGSAFQTPFREQSGNVATNIFCLSDYSDPKEALHELSRIIHKRGVLMYLDYSDKDGYWTLRREQHDPDVVMGNIHLRNPETIKAFLPNDLRIIQNIIIEYEVQTSEFDQRVDLPDEITRAFIFVEMYKPRSI